MTPKAKSAPQPVLRTAVLFALPLLALATVIAVFLTGGATAELQSSVPIEALTLERYVLERGGIELHVRNSGPEDITISQVIINDAVWPHRIEPHSTISRLGRATVQLDYMWSYGEAYAIRLLSSNSVAFDIDIPIAVETARPSLRTFLGFTLIGLYVGIIPVFLGIAWFPALRRVGRRAMAFLLAATLGILAFLGIDTLVEAREAAVRLPNAFQGIGLIAIGVVATVLLLEAIAVKQREAAGNETQRRLAVAFLIAVGIGLHNLGEGLAIGAAYNLGEIALGRFLVVGFIMQNITEGLGVVAPVLRESPGIRRLALLGMIAGGPAILGTWIGGFAPSPFLSVLFLTVGAGAIIGVIIEILRLLRRDTAAQASPLSVYAGVVAGMLVVWVTGLLIK
jgi:zinc transporter ZupT